MELLRVALPFTVFTYATGFSREIGRLTSNPDLFQGILISCTGIGSKSGKLPL